MTLTVEEKIRRYLAGPKHYKEGMNLLMEVTTKRKLWTKIYKASFLPGTKLYKFFRTKLIYELELYLKGDRQPLQGVKDWTENFHH